MSKILTAIPGPGFKPTFEMVNSDNSEIRASQVQNLKEWMEWTESLLDQVVGAGQIITLGSTVKEERTYGLSSSAGSSALGARVDHTHGSPGLSSNAPPSDSFTASVAGTGLAPSRDDHLHLIPEDAYITFTATGSNLVWTMPKAYTQSSIIAFIGPTPLVPGSDFTTSGTTFTLNAAWASSKFGMPPQTIPFQNFIVFRGRY